MVSSNMSLPIDVGNDELIILLWRYHERFEEGCGKGGGVEGDSEGAPPGRRKQNKPDLSRVNILGMINLSRCNRLSHL